MWEVDSIINIYQLMKKTDHQIKPKKEIKKLSEIEQRVKKMETTFDESNWIVIDNGTESIKSGYSGQDLPRVI
jgi:hypothetical protein